jgi:uncharacterized protein YjaG (DUF416 family)
MAIAEINKLKELNFTKQLAFAYLTCERLYPNYIYFSKKYEFGNPDILRTTIDFLYSNLFDNKADKVKINSLIKKVDKNIPEPADYDTILASSALDASTVIIESLNFLIDKQTSRLDDISTMATDTADMYIQDVENLDYNTDKYFQQKIDTHPLMIKEISIQKGIISYLAKIKNIEPLDISTLLQLQENNKGSLSLK